MRFAGLFSRVGYNITMEGKQNFLNHMYEKIGYHVDLLRTVVERYCM
jgi:hypothetical protein